MSRFLRRGATPAAKEPYVDAKLLDEDASTPNLSTQELLTYPGPSCKTQTAPQHSAKQKEILASLKSHLLALHQDLEAKDASYVLWERRWIEDPSTARRYANAVKWDVAQARKRLTDTLNWRREFKPDLLIPDEVKREGESGKHIISGFDNESRPVLYLRPGRENTEPNPQQVRYLVWSLERAIDFCPENQDKICLLIDYNTATQHTQPSFATSKSVLNILQNHYPERLGKAIVCNVPWILSSFFTFISPFLDPNTRQKIAMLRSPDNVKESIPVDMLDLEYGGQWRYQFNFDKYWNTLLDFCGIAPDGTRTHPTKARPVKEVNASQAEEVKAEEHQDRTAEQPSLKPEESQ